MNKRSFIILLVFIGSFIENARAQSSGSMIALKRVVGKGDWTPRFACRPGKANAILYA